MKTLRSALKSRCWLFAAILIGTYFGLAVVTPVQSAEVQQMQPASSQVKTGKHIITFTTAAPEAMPIFEQFKAFYSEAFRRIGFQFQLQYHPDNRSLIEANSGRADGTCGRIMEVGSDEMYSDLFRVDEVVKTYRSVGWALDSKYFINGWKSFNGYKLTYVKGNKYIENTLYKHVAKEKVAPRCSEWVKTV